jgi:CBS domain-containing protein
MRISTLLSDKGGSVVTIRGEATVGEAVGALVRHRIGALVVVDDRRHIAGIVSERDIVGALNRSGFLLEEPVASIMSTTVHTCRPEDDTDQLMATMTERRIRHLPVVDAGSLVGIVSIGDVVKAKMEALERDRAELVDYINAR